MAKFDEYFQKRDPQLMLREKFWVHLKREPTQSLDSWIVTGAASVGVLLDNLVLSTELTM